MDHREIKWTGNLRHFYKIRQKLLAYKLARMFYGSVDSVQDDKITQQIKSAIEFFETKTGFILRAGTLKLNFDSKNLYNKRPVRKKLFGLIILPGNNFLIL